MKGLAYFLTGPPFDRHGFMNGEVQQRFESPTEVYLSAIEIVAISDGAQDCKYCMSSPISPYTPKMMKATTVAVHKNLFTLVAMRIPLSWSTSGFRSSSRGIHSSRRCPATAFLFDSNCSAVILDGPSLIVPSLASILAIVSMRVQSVLVILLSKIRRLGPE
ncbi:hypothetical protein EJ03DRAFT_79538 [Teratosphaeria nubilosa]|uniref:Uncharacterized protein n=1 Tax=Teratosphaeria nubilosa TaxID=161662 RepID=A0A6G1LAW4_9PEZI|nr:hypothetical protein EJ03DRAFT_79538 [Teratosphaeria nubilosa]